MTLVKSLVVGLASTCGEEGQGHARRQPRHNAFRTLGGGAGQRLQQRGGSAVGEGAAAGQRGRSTPGSGNRDRALTAGGALHGSS